MLFVQIASVAALLREDRHVDRSLRLPPFPPSLSAGAAACRLRIPHEDSESIKTFEDESSRYSPGLFLTVRAPLKG